MIVKQHNGVPFITVKMGKANYDITEKDKFVDDDQTIECCTQRLKHFSENKIYPVLSKRTYQLLKKSFSVKYHHKHNRGKNKEVFSFNLST